MATVNKDFRIKAGLVVEGTTATVDGEDIITTGSTTDSLPEGSTNVYYTEGRAKTDAAELLTGATLTNITITGDGDGLTITAENGGIEDLTGFDTDDLTEGTTNLYFTNQRALDATSAAYDAAGAASAAQTAAESYADGLASNYEPAGAAATAESNANGYTDSAIDALTTDDIEEGSTNLYFTNQRALDATSSAYDAAGAAATALSDAQDYADGLVQGLSVKDAVVTASTENIDLANDTPATVGGVTIQDGDRVLLKDQSSAGENGIYVYNSFTKRLTRAEDQSTPERGDYALVTSGTYAATGWLVSSVGILSSNTWTQFSAANEYTASTGITITGNAISVTADTYDAFGAAAQALEDANDYTDTAISGLSSVYEPIGAAATAVGSLTTDDIEEGENLYFTDERAIDAVSAADIYPNAVIVNNVSKTVANALTASTASTVSGLTWAKADYRSAKLVVKAETATHSQVSEVMVTLDASDNVAITEFGVVYTDEELATITADVSGTDVRIRVTTLNASTNVMVVGTLLI
jgi:hypothetical protein